MRWPSRKKSLSTQGDDTPSTSMGIAIITSDNHTKFIQPRLRIDPINDPLPNPLDDSINSVPFQQDTQYFEPLPNPPTTPLPNPFEVPENAAIAFNAMAANVANQYSIKYLPTQPKISSNDYPLPNVSLLSRSRSTSVSKHGVQNSRTDVSKRLSISSLAAVASKRRAPSPVNVPVFRRKSLSFDITPQLAEQEGDTLGFTHADAGSMLIAEPYNSNSSTNTTGLAASAIFKDSVSGTLKVAPASAAVAPMIAVENSASVLASVNVQTTISAPIPAKPITEMRQLYKSSGCSASLLSTTSCGLDPSSSHLESSNPSSSSQSLPNPAPRNIIATCSTSSISAPTTCSIAPAVEIPVDQIITKKLPHCSSQNSSSRQLKHQHSLSVESEYFSHGSERSIIFIPGENNSCCSPETVDSIPLFNCETPKSFEKLVEPTDHLNTEKNYPSSQYVIIPTPS